MFPYNGCFTQVLRDIGSSPARQTTVDTFDCDNWERIKKKSPEQTA